jgi:hypothetical protein
MLLLLLVLHIAMKLFVCLPPSPPPPPPPTTMMKI